MGFAAPLVDIHLTRTIPSLQISRFEKGKSVSQEPSQPVTELLVKWKHGDTKALDALLPRAVLRRFQSERQSLAIMEHPAIAKVFDAGATPDGQPYYLFLSRTRVKSKLCSGADGNIELTPQPATKLQ
jgi:hypothetical protein